MTDMETKDGLNWYFAGPEELTAGTMERIISLVEAGGSVSSQWVRRNLEHAFLIGYVLDGDEIVGCATLKEPRAEFTAMVREQTGLDLDGFLERGYASVLPAYRGRGLGSGLLAGLTARVGDRKLYSVIGEDNVGGQKIALNNNTRKVAVYESLKTGKKLGVWMPQWVEPRWADT